MPIRWSRWRPVRVACGALVAVAAVAVAMPRAAQSTPDLLIVNGRLFTGSGAIGPLTSVAVRDGRIVRVGDAATVADASRSRAALTIDARGGVIAPGFIDVHSHALETITRAELRGAAPLLAQGVTTVIGNPDGGGPTDLATQSRALMADGGIAVNAGLLIGHGAVRSAVIGGANRAPTPAELERMRAIVRQAVADGALGLSSGLFYTPGRFAKTDEVIELAKVAGGVYTSHIRDEGNYDVGVVASVDEVIRVAEEAHVTGVVSHMKALGPDSWGKSAVLIEHIAAARARGVDVWADQYPYEASSTSLAAAVLPGVSTADARARVNDPARRSALLAEAAENIRRRGGAHAIAIASSPAGRPAGSLNGKRLDDIASAAGVSAPQAAVDIIVNGGASIVSFNMSEDDIRAIMRQPWTMTSSDGGLSLPGVGVPHPRNNGAFARKLAVYVRERHVLPVAQALTSMTSLPAKIFGLTDRGVIAVGAIADIVVFDPAAVVDRATYERPHALATGVSTVVVNGVVAWNDGAPTGARAGVVIRRDRK